MFRLLAILSVTATFSMLLVLIALTQGIDKAIIIIPVFLAVGATVYTETIENVTVAA